MKPAVLPASAPSAPPPFALIADSVTSARTLEELVRPLLEVLEAFTGMESTYLTSIDERAGLQHVLYARNTRQMQIPERLTVPWSDTLCKRALDENRMFTDDVADCWGDSDAARALGIQTYVSTPVRFEDGTLYGTLCAASARRMPLAGDAERALRMFSRLIGQHLERERLLGELQAANAALAATALVDSVTGLPNRRALMQEMERRLSHCQRQHETLLVAFIDLDGFKAVNDRHGHDVGDRFLAAVGRALSGALRSDDFAARLGGDEFVVLGSVGGGDTVPAIDALHQRLANCTRGRFDLGGTVLEYAGPSIGVIAADDASQDAESLIARADEAMYAVKRHRRANAA